MMQDAAARRDMSRRRGLRTLDDIVQHVQIGLAVFKVGTQGDPKTYTLFAFNPAAEHIAKMELAPRIGDALPRHLPFARGEPGTAPGERRA